MVGEAFNCLMMNPEDVLSSGFSVFYNHLPSVKCVLSPRMLIKIGIAKLKLVVFRVVYLPMTNKMDLILRA